jgi:hypothetical protein
MANGHLIKAASGHLKKAISGHLVNGPPPVITTTTLPNALYGIAYSIQMAATGGTGSYTWSLDSGSFPSGITMSSSGLISGTSTATAGTFSVTLKCSDTSGKTASTTLSLVLLDALFFKMTAAVWNNWQVYRLCVQDPTPTTTVTQGTWPRGNNVYYMEAVKTPAQMRGTYYAWCYFYDDSHSYGPAPITVAAYRGATLIASKTETISAGYTGARITVSV